MVKTSTEKRHKIELSHLDKIFFEKPKVIKGDVVAYYQKVAQYMVPHMKNRPLMMQRAPDGILGEWFYQKEISDYFPTWIARKKVTLKKGVSQTLTVIKKDEDLVYLANQAVLAFHPWMSMVDHLKKPSQMIFDFDPSGKINVKNLHFAAREVKKLLEDNGLTPFVMTTGSRGYHVVVPLKPINSFTVVRSFARLLAEELVDTYPDIFTLEMSIKKRAGKIFIDYLRNSYGATSVAPYSLRLKRGAPIATPLDWDELSRTDSQSYTIKNIMKRLAAKGDPWERFEKAACTLKIKKD